MKVWMVEEDYGECISLFATYELAAAYCDPLIARLWTKVIDPDVEMTHPGWGGRRWRADHYSAMGFAAFREQQLSSMIQEMDVQET